MSNAKGLIMSLMLMVLAICASVGTAEELTYQERELFKCFDGKVTIEPQKTKKAIDRAALPAVAMKASTREYLETHGPHAGKVFTRTVKPTRSYPKSWPATSKGAVTDTIPGDYVFYQIMDKDRGLISLVELDLHSTVQVAYQPGEIMVPSSGNVDPYKVKVKVYDLNNPTSVKHTGEFNVQTKDRGQWTVKTPAGTFDCVLYTTTYNGSVGPASVKDTAMVFVNPEHGVIAKVTRNKVSAFLVYNADDRFGFVLNKKPAS